MSASPPRLFGTDGIRGRFGEPPLDRVTVTALARHLAADLDDRVAAAAAAASPAAAIGTAIVSAPAALGAATLLAAAPAAALAAAPPLVLLGGDTRDSTPDLCAWLAAGLAAGGVQVRYAGVIPTPGVAFLAPHLGATAGIAVSASHNPWPDNGIKLLDGDGLKWSDAAEQSLTARLAASPTRHPAEAPHDGPAPAAAHEPGTAPAAPYDVAAPAAPSAAKVPPAAASAPSTAALPPVDPSLRAAYLDHLASTLPPGPAPLAGLRIVLDAGNGAASTYAGELFDRLGAEVTLLGIAPDGRNVNRGNGSTAPEKMAAAVVAAGAHLGAAFDGDADRCILADETGAVCDGDAILYLWATGLLAAGHLAPPRIVATSMSNLGLERALARHGIGVVRCDVGDRWVVEAMRREGIRLGGEQSGHIVCFGLSNTGDGLLTALQCAARVHRSGQPLSRLLAGFRRYPQILQNVGVARKPDLATLPRVAAAVHDVERALGDDGRLVLRYSGTEPLVRVMIEGPDQTTIESLAAHLATILASELS